MAGLAEMQVGKLRREVRREHYRLEAKLHPGVGRLEAAVGADGPLDCFHVQADLHQDHFLPGQDPQPGHQLRPDGHNLRARAVQPLPHLLFMINQKQHIYHIP